MPRKKLYRRIRRKLCGGTMDMRIYTDGTMRARLDHPSNDPEIEMAMAGRLLRECRAYFEAQGLPEPVMEPIAWRDDPPP